MAKSGRLSLALACALLACGGDDPPADATGSELLAAWPADGSFTTGVSPELALADLDDEDRQAVCVATTNAFPPLASCPTWGLLVAYNLAFDPGYQDGGAPVSDQQLRDACTRMRRQCARDLAPAERLRRAEASAKAVYVHAHMDEETFDTDRIRQGTMWTRTGQSRIPGTASFATPRELARLLVKIEQGQVVDAWSSLEMKRYLYQTKKRYRYTYAPELAGAAVFLASRASAYVTGQAVFVDGGLSVH